MVVLVDAIVGIVMMQEFYNGAGTLARRTYLQTVSARVSESRNSTSPLRWQDVGRIRQRRRSQDALILPLHDLVAKNTRRLVRMTRYASRAARNPRIFR